MKTCFSHTHTHQLLQYGAAELVAQGPGLRSGGEVCQNPSCKVTDPHFHMGVLQQAEDVLQQVLLQQVRLQHLHLCYVVLQHNETNDSSDGIGGRDT